ncbi:hypothetical protein H2203_007821 [Taxawa tesnikishii (nom. ined.)]|nr:hypothetical protein H2203_007821 [Dothideales sp. JES 119]
MGIIRCHLGEYCLASGLFSRALVIEPNLAIAHFLLGVANCELETYDVALTAFTACAAVLSQSAYVADYRMMDLDFVLKYDKAVANIQITASEVAHKNEYPHSTNGHLLHRLPAGLIFESPSERRWTFLINSRRRKDLAIPSRASKRSKRLTSQERDRPLPPVPINAISGGDTKRPDAGAALKARHKLSRSCGKNEILPQKVNRDSPGLPDRLKGLVQFVKHVAPGHKRALSEAQSTGHTIRDGTSSLTTPKPPSLRFSSDEHTVPEEEHKIGAQSGAEDTIPFGSLYGRWSSTSSVYSRPVDSMYPSKPLFAYRAPQVSEISGSETEPFLTMRFTPGPEGSTSEIQEGEATAKILREYLSDSSTRSPHCLPHLSDQDEKNLIRSLLPEQEREEEEEVEEEAYNPMREYFARLSTPGSTNASIFNGLERPPTRVSQEEEEEEPDENAYAEGTSGAPEADQSGG